MHGDDEETVALLLECIDKDEDGIFTYEHVCRHIVGDYDFICYTDEEPKCFDFCHCSEYDGHADCDTHK